jgi:uncharacterized protein (DUF885 family)
MDTPAAVSNAPAALAKVADDYWDWQLEESPIACTYLGLRRGLDRIDEAGPAARERRERALHAFLRRVEDVAPDALSAEERITRAVLLREMSESIEALRHRGWEWALDQLQGPHVVLQDLLSLHPLEKPSDGEAMVSRWRETPRVFGDHEQDLRDGIESGRVAPKVAYERVLGQVKSFVAKKDAETSFLGVLERLPKAWPSADRSRIASALKKAFEEAVRPSYAGFGKFLETAYAGKARAHPGVWSTPGGVDAYAFLARRHTTTTLSPDRIHAIGVEELERNEREMLEIARSEGWKGELRGFLDSIGKDPRFRLKSREDVLARYRSICARMEARLPEAFGLRPADSCTVKPLEEYREKDAPGAYYIQPALDGSRPGIFYANTHDPSSWPTYDMEALSFHEAVPGHHLQVALAQRLEGLPVVRRHAMFTAYVEGWAHYAERLADEMHAYSTPYDRVGMLGAQAWRAARLVVDTGIHHLKWDRAKALDVLRRIKSGPMSDAENELDRYIIWPGQALAYKVGQRTILEIRERAKRRLGARFSLPAFHDEVLRHGALPLSILEDVVRTWEPTAA